MKFSLREGIFETKRAKGNKRKLKESLKRIKINKTKIIIITKK